MLASAPRARLTRSRQATRGARLCRGRLCRGRLIGRLLCLARLVQIIDELELQIRKLLQPLLDVRQHHHPELRLEHLYLPAQQPILSHQVTHLAVSGGGRYRCRPRCMPCLRLVGGGRLGQAFALRELLLQRDELLLQSLTRRRARHRALQY